jgi:hypothetical protein
MYQVIRVTPLPSIAKTIIAVNQNAVKVVATKDIAVRTG